MSSQTLNNKNGLSNMAGNSKVSINKFPTIGVFDSGIGGFSILKELFKIIPEAIYYYYSDEAHAPYGAKTDAYITDRCLAITQKLLDKGAEIIVVACNTATASSIDALRASFKNVEFVGVEPYLNAYSKTPGTHNKMVVLTTESTGNSERFKKLKTKLDPYQSIDHLSLKNLASMVETLYHNPAYEAEFDKKLIEELSPLQGKNYTHAILGCTHYPLVREKIEKILHLKTLSPCPYVAHRVRSLLEKSQHKDENLTVQSVAMPKTFFFYSSKTQNWEELQRHGPPFGN